MFNIKNKCIEYRHRFFVGLAICFGVAIASPVAFAQEKGANDLVTRLANLEKRIEEERKKQHIPGVAIAVIKDDCTCYGGDHCDSHFV